MPPSIYSLGSQNSDPLTGSSFDFGTANVGSGMQPVNYGFGGMVGAGAGGQGFGVNPNGVGGGMPPVTAGGLGFGMNANTFGAGFQGLSALTNLYTGLQGLKLAKQQFQFGKEMALRNEKNAVGDYNRSLEAQEGRKAITSGLSKEEGQANYNRYKAVSA